MKFNPKTHLYEFNPNTKYWVSYKGSVRYTTVFFNDNYMGMADNGNYTSASEAATFSLKGWGCDLLRNSNDFDTDRRKFIKKHLISTQKNIKYYEHTWLQPIVTKIIKNFPELAI